MIKRDSKPGERTYFTCTCVDIHLGRVEPASPIGFTKSRIDAPQAHDRFSQSCAVEERGSRVSFKVVAYVFSWPPVRLRPVRGGVGRCRLLISSPSGRLVA